MNQEEAIELLHEYFKNENMRKHCTEAMRGISDELGL
jgi:predicted hydrolase (HD superfamily)